MEASNLAAAESAHDTLVFMGGRPTRTIQRDPGCWDPSEENEEDLWLIRHYSMEGARFRAELENWQLFRDYQRHIRQDLRTFLRIQKHVDTYWQRKYIEEDLKPQLNIRPQMQTKVDEWKEFFFCQHQMRGPKELEILKARKQARSLLDELEATGTGRSLILSTDAVYAGKRWVDMAMNDLKKWDKWLAWIAQQLPIITLEYGPYQCERGDLRREMAHQVSSPQSRWLASKRTPKNIRTEPSTTNSFKTSPRAVPPGSRRRGRNKINSCTVSRISKARRNVNAGGRMDIPRRSARIARMQRSA